MAGGISIKGHRARVGERMTKGGGWRLAATKGSKRIFFATLKTTVNAGNVRLAVFSVPK